MGAPSLRFEERMSGYIAGPGTAAGDFEAAYAIGRQKGLSIQFQTTISHDNLPELLDNPASPARITGTVLAPMLCEEPLEITQGTFILLEHQPDAVETDWMVYKMTLRSHKDPEQQFVLMGHKVIAVGSIFSAWSHTTTLYVTLYKGAQVDTRSVVALGVMHIGLSDVHHLVAHAEVDNVSHWERDRYLARFGAMFIRSLWPFYGGSLDELARFPAESPVTGSAAKVVADADEVRLCDPSGTWYPGDESVHDACSRLLRYRGGNKGPLVMASGFGMSATSLYSDGVRPGLAAYLAGHGYDVWLFDYRAGIDLPSAQTQFTIDDIALVDWPRAVDEVLRITGVRTVQGFGHCVGSVSLLMALLDPAGVVTGKIRSAVCAQFSVHPMTSKLKILESDLHVGSLLEVLGKHVLRPDGSRGLGHIALDLALKAVPLPEGEACQLPVCRWINAVYGLTHRHAQLDDATHQMIPQLFGEANMRALEHLGLMMQRGRAVDAQGRDVYLQDAGRIAQIPIHFIAGERNYIFHPQGTERTLKWLSDAGQTNKTMSLLPEYAHLDALIGRSAETEVFPIVLDQLDRYQQSPAVRTAASL